jgi:hypothetical protein
MPSAHFALHSFWIWSHIYTSLCFSYSWDHRCSTTTPSFLADLGSPDFLSGLALNCSPSNPHLLK